MVKNSLRALREGKKLLIFPEGTRTVVPPVNVFRRSFAVIARSADASPVRLVFVESNTPCLGKGWPLWKLPKFPLRYRLTLGEEVNVPRGSGRQTMGRPGGGRIPHRVGGQSRCPRDF